LSSANIAAAIPMRIPPASADQGVKAFQSMVMGELTKRFAEQG
jgi:hypothetical protein